MDQGGVLKRLEMEHEWKHWELAATVQFTGV